MCGPGHVQAKFRTFSPAPFFIISNFNNFPISTLNMQVLLALICEAVWEPYYNSDQGLLLTLHPGITPGGGGLGKPYRVQEIKSGLSLSKAAR